MQIVLLYSPFPDRAEAKEIAEALIERDLIACANIVESDSIYIWEGDLQKEDEYLLLAKTAPEKEEAVRDEIKAMHSYDVPCILSLTPAVNDSYAAWIEEQVRDRNA